MLLSRPFHFCWSMVLTVWIYMEITPSALSISPHFVCVSVGRAQALAGLRRWTRSLFLSEQRPWRPLFVLRGADHDINIQSYMAPGDQVEVSK